MAIWLIDDLRDFRPGVVPLHERVTISRTSRDASKNLWTLPKGEYFDQVWFDHDLGIVDGEDDTTIDLARSLSLLVSQGRIGVGMVLIHSANPVGAGNLFSIFKTGEIPVVRVDARDYLTNVITKGGDFKK